MTRSRHRQSSTCQKNPDTWRADGALFYRLTSTGEDPEHEKPADRCFGHAVLSEGISIFDLFDSKEIRDWKHGTLFVEPGVRLDDLPWNTANQLIVSDRLKALLEDLAPRQVQYLPMKVIRAKWKLVDLSRFVVQRKGSRILAPLGSYWLMNTLMEVDCMNVELAKTDLYRTCIETSRVPPNVQVFRIKGRAASAFCRRKVREACVAAGMRGVQFRWVMHTGEGA
ncbi:MAG: hypothetical protein JSR77_13115 [Planctomycetes bacterium]|nr:hypothetical protein [Planctomycetota bacterium]